MESNYLETKPSSTQIRGSMGSIHMELAYLIAANTSIRDEVTKKFSYIDIFEFITLPRNGRDPIPQFFRIVGKILSVSAGTAKVDVSVVHEDGTLLAAATLRGDVKDGDLDLAAAFGPLAITKGGKYYLRVSYNDIPLADGNKFYFTAV